MKDNDFILERQSKYCYLGTRVLKNKMDIHDQDKLIEVENGITTYKLSKLYLGERPYKQTFDVRHYFNIHKYLFEDIYSFAGEIRDENMYKSREPYKNDAVEFCKCNFVYRYLKETLEEMNHNVRKIVNRDILVTFLSKYYLDLNIIHPFREGNGRTLRYYLYEYVEMLNKYLTFGNFRLNYDFDENTKEALFKASVLDDLLEMEKVFDKILVEQNVKEGSNENEKHI